MNVQVRFETWKEHPSPEALLSLLQGCETTVYNICYQILRHAQNAEDATQRVLVEIPNGVKRIAHGEQFRRWLYRVSFHVALNVKRDIKTRMAHEKNKAETAESNRSPGSEERDEAIHEMINRLDDRTRALIIEHYFERKSLEMMATEQGCSRITLWKRLQKAKQNLRKSLPSGGFATAVSSLENMVPARASRSLITDDLAAKTATIAVGSPSIYPLALGSLLMNAKALTGLLAIVLAVILSAGFARRTSHETPTLDTVRAPSARTPATIPLATPAEIHVQQPHVPNPVPETTSRAVTTLRPPPVEVPPAYSSWWAFEKAIVAAVHIPDNSKCWKELRRLGIPLSDEEFQKVKQIFNEQFRNHSDDAWSKERSQDGSADAIALREHYVLAAWARKDPKGAATFLSSDIIMGDTVEKTGFRSVVLCMVGREWSLSDPSQFASWVDGLNPADRKDILAYLADR
jgi:RNA polymerase sigma factor (sigma-70 family)